MNLRDYRYQLNEEEMLITSFEYDVQAMTGIVGVTIGERSNCFQIIIPDGQENVNASNVDYFIQQNYPNSIRTQPE